MFTVNETFMSETETETRRRHLTLYLRRDRDKTSLQNLRDETETFQKQVSRPSRNREVETETTSLCINVLCRRYDESHQRWILLCENKLILEPHGRRQMSHMKQSAVAVGCSLHRCRFFLSWFIRLYSNATRASWQVVRHACLSEACDSSFAKFDKF